MQELKQFAVMLVFLSAAGLIYYFLLPSGRVSRTAKSILSVCFLLAALSPLFSLASNVSPVFSFEESSIGSAFDGNVIDAAKAALVRQIESVIAGYTDTPCEVSVSAHIGEDHSIEIEQVNILFDAEIPDVGALKDALREALGFQPVLTVREDE